MSNQPTVPPAGGGDPFDPSTALERVKIPGYEVLSELGRGGMGVVYKARQTNLKRLVALKMILVGIHEDQEVLDRFRTEAEAVARFHHPNIVQIFEIGTVEQVPFFSLEYVEGGTLAEYLKSRAPSFREAAQLVEQMARAVDDAHRKGIIHRDLKPANVLLAFKRRITEEESRRGLKRPLEDFTPKIADFGLAKNLAAKSQTARGKVMGTPSYMAPEQAGAAGGVGPAADIYALGAILYEMLAGRAPFRAANPMDTVLQVLENAPPAPHTFRPDVPRDLEAIALKCLAKKPRERYHTASALANDLQHFLEGRPGRHLPVQPLSDGMTEPKQAPANPTNGWRIATLILAVIVVALLAYVALR